MSNVTDLNFNNDKIRRRSFCAQDLIMKSILILLSIFSLVSSREFCTPNDAGCWPSDEEIESFKLSLSSPTSDCLDFVPTFSSKSDPGELIYNYWY